MQRAILDALAGAMMNSPFRADLTKDTAIARAGVVPHGGMPYPYAVLSDGRIFCPFAPISGKRPLGAPTSTKDKP